MTTESHFIDEIRRPFQQLIANHQERVQEGAEQLGQLQPLQRDWTRARQNLEDFALPLLDRWKHALDALVEPVEQEEQLKRERKRLLRLPSRSRRSFPRIMIRLQIILIWILVTLKSPALLLKALLGFPVLLFNVLKRPVTLLLQASIFLLFLYSLYRVLALLII